jgi:hypothetical protein
MADMTRARSRRGQPGARAGIGALVAVLGVAMPAMAQQLPTGGSVVGGSATITQNTTSQLTINQTTGQGVIDWRSFSVGSAIIQPGGTSVTLNRVVGPDPSVIAGRLNVNGQVRLTGAVAAPDGTDKRTVRESGLTGLAGSGTARNGAINARVKRASVGGRETVTVDLAGDGLLELQLGKPVPAAPQPPSGAMMLSAAEARGVVNSIANVQAMPRATGASVEGGVVVFGGTR